MILQFLKTLIFTFIVPESGLKIQMNSLRVRWEKWNYIKECLMKEITTKNRTVDHPES